MEERQGYNENVAFSQEEPSEEATEMFPPPALPK